MATVSIKPDDAFALIMIRRTYIPESLRNYTLSHEVLKMVIPSVHVQLDMMVQSFWIPSYYDRPLTEKVPRFNSTRSFPVGRTEKKCVHEQASYHHVLKGNMQGACCLSCEHVTLCIPQFQVKRRHWWWSLSAPCVVGCSASSVHKYWLGPLAKGSPLSFQSISFNSLCCVN
jgi:hypothetical protein